LKLFNSDIVENAAIMGSVAGTALYFGSYIYAINKHNKNDLYLMLVGLGTLLGSVAIAETSRYAGKRLYEIKRERQAAEPQPVYKPLNKKEHMNLSRKMGSKGWVEETRGVWIRPADYSRNT